MTSSTSVTLDTSDYAWELPDELFQITLVNRDRFWFFCENSFAWALRNRNIIQSDGFPDQDGLVGVVVTRLSLNVEFSRQLAAQGEYYVTMLYADAVVMMDFVEAFAVVSGGADSMKDQMVQMMAFVLLEQTRRSITHNYEALEAARIAEALRRGAVHFGGDPEEPLYGFFK